MSTSPESDFDLEKHFLPAWAKETPSANRYAKYTGNEDRADSRSDARRGPRRDGPTGGGGGGGARFPRRDGPGGQVGGPRRDAGGRGPGGPGGPGGGRSFGGGRGPGRGPEQREEERREPAIVLPEINVTLMPDEKGVDSLARQIKMTGRAYPLFDIAQMILQKPERQQVRFESAKKPDGTALNPLFICALDDSIWASQEEAVSHVLEKHFGTFYQAEKIPTEAPKGTYTFVAQCGMSGVILGPPNYHDYQNQLRRLHSERFSRMPFEAFKARVKIVRDEAVVKKWLEDQSFRTEYIGLNVPEPVTLSSRADVDRHFQEVHVPNIIKQVDATNVSGPASREIRSQPLQRLLRRAWEEQKRFPIKVVNVLSQQFASRGLQFFKVNKTITHVAVARPHYLDLDTTAVSDGVRKIVEFINATPKCTRRKLLETLAPAPAGTPAPAAPQPALEGAAPSEAGPAPTAEQSAVISDLHWLIHQGHVIEFANGTLETAKKPAPKPQPQPKAAAASAGTPAAGQQPTTPAAPAAAQAQQQVDGGEEAGTVDSSAAAGTEAEAQAAEATPEPPASQS